MEINKKIERKAEEIVEDDLESEIEDIAGDEMPASEPYGGIDHTDRVEDLKRDWKLKLEHLFEECFGNNAKTYEEILEIVEFDFNATSSDDKFAENFAPEEVVKAMIFNDEEDYFDMLKEYKKELEE